MQMLKAGDIIQVKEYDAEDYKKVLAENGVHTKIITEYAEMKGCWLEVTEVEPYEGKTWRDKHERTKESDSRTRQGKP